MLSEMTFALRVGEEMLESSVSVSEVEDELRRLLAAFGLQECEVSVTLNVVTLCYLPSREHDPVTLIKVVHDTEPRLDRLSALEGLIRQVENGELGITEAVEAIDQLDSAPPPYNATIRTIAMVVSIAAWVVFAGGGLYGIASGALAGLAMVAITEATHTQRIPSVFVSAAHAAVAVAAPMGLAALGAPIAIAPAITGGLYPLLPGRLLIASVTDGLGGAPISAAAKGLEAAFMTTAVAFGALSALALAENFGVTSPVVATSAPFGIALVAGPVAVAALAVSRSLPPRFVTVSALIAAAAYAVSQIPLGGHEGLPAASLAAAAVIGLGGQLAARFYSTTAAIHTTSAIYVLVPGFAFYTAIQAFAQGSTNLGVHRLVTALGIAVAVGTGVAAGVAAGRTVPSPRARVTVWPMPRRIPTRAGRSATRRARQRPE